ncbi:kinase-like domain-containing protein [Parasitella parasitica]|nr:kinase-like domain-containing protein [Parasitella parasitica]
MQQVNGVPVLSSDPGLIYYGLDKEPTWFSAQGGVYKCIERATNKQVAIKKYLVEENQYEDMFVMPKELVENEIYSMTKCVHPNILKLLAVHLHQEFVFLVMPLCTGGSLQQYVFEHHLTVGQLVHIITSIASGLAKVHGHGYIHRDIKCDNIFLDQGSNTIVIGDFGVVSISPAADSSVEEAGVVLFWSPELVQQKIVNHKVDVWALGIVILEVLNGGKAPYEDEKLDEEEIKERILQNGKPEYPPDLPSRLVDLLDCCLDPDPRTRSSASSILQHPFLNDYEPELLFPATRIDQDISSQSESDPSDIMHDVEQENMLDRKEFNTGDDMHCFDTGLSSVLPLSTVTTATVNSDNDTIMIEKPPSSPPHPAKCRLPVPAFSVDKSVSASMPVKEKIANVIRKRQSISDSYRSQGSRIPMLCILQPVIEDLKDPRDIESNAPRLRSVKSVKLQASIQNKSVSGDSKENFTRKPLSRSITVPLRIDQVLKVPNRQLKPPTATQSTVDKLSQKRASQRSPLSELKANTSSRRPKINTSIATTPKLKRELPPKSSVYRKRLPAGESRTARLMMGVSTNGRRQSFKQREEMSTEELSPTLGHRFGKLFGSSNKHEPTSPTSSNKKRPMSYAASSSSSNIPPPSFKSIPTIPSSDNKLKRQSVPATPKSLDNDRTKRSSKKSNNSNSSSKENGHSLKNSIKALRVH